jgi:EmrB/QacA subfamily drug resistance transporter
MLNGGVRPAGGRFDTHRFPLWWVLAICCAGQFMVVLDVSIVNVALPQMRTDLHLTTTGQQWVVNAYTLTFAGFLMLGARTADLFGRRRIFLLGLGLFTLFSLVGGLAEDGPWLIIARAAQGVGGAILAPSSLSLLTTTFTDPEERRRALGAWAATASSGAAIGVLAGGVLTDLLSWRWVLIVNVPIGILLLAASTMALADSRPDRRSLRLDVPGALTITAGLAAVVYGVVNTDTHGWSSPVTIAALAVGGGLLAAFIAIEARFASSPLVPLGVFRRRSLVAANGIAVTIGMALFGMTFFLSLYLQQVNGYSPLESGFAFLPFGLCTLVGALSGTGTMNRVGPRRQLVLGPGMGAIGLVWLAQTTAGAPYLSHVLGPLLLVGLGLGLAFVPMAVVATAGMPPHQAGLASGLINTTRQIGGAVGLAAMATVAAAAASRHRAGLHASAAAVTDGYDRAFFICAVALVVGAGLATFLLPRPRPTDRRTLKKRNNRFRLCILKRK